MENPYVSGGKIRFENSYFENIVTTDYDPNDWGQSNADAIRSHISDANAAKAIGTTVQIDSVVFRNVEKSSLKLNDVKSIVNNVKTYNDLHLNKTEYTQYACYRANSTKYFRIENSECHGRV